ncbi:AIR synthase family protein [candidate division WOR-3 bacterium]|nr:AIR synthase family protein [candidate division WOR-3 bacterium]
MAKLPEIGKISAEFFNELIYPHLGSKRSEILVGPQHGVDVGIVEIGNKAVAMTSDPVFIVPEYGFKRAAWFAIHILASDVVTSGLAPTYLTIDLNLPMSMTEEELTTVWETIDKECKKMGMAIICGHTARYDNCHYPMVGGATVLAVGDLDEYVSPKFARVGDKLIITKGPAIEASGIFATMFPRFLTKEFGEEFARSAQSLFYKMSVVDDAMSAIKTGVRDEGVSAMHDATECGIWGGVFEIAQAAEVGAIIEKEKIVVEECVNEICSIFKIDPYKSISEGTLIITCREEKAESLVEILKNSNINASIVGELIDSKFGILLIENGKEKKLEHPKVDPFWKAFYDALERYKEVEL